MLEYLRIISGSSNTALSKEISEFLDIRLTRCLLKTFSDGEIMVEIGENIRNRDVYIIQSTCPPVNDNIMELLLLADAARRASARSITAVVPYYGYARQDRKVAPRVPISAKLVADLISVSGVSRVLAMDLHAGQIQGFFKIPVDNLFAAPVLLDDIKVDKKNDLIIVSPDAGGVERARAFAKRLNAKLAIIDKRRDSPNEAKAMNIIGEVKGLKAIILDDMVDTAGTLSQAADALLAHGAESVTAYCVHGVLSGPALDRINNSSLKEVVVTNTIPLNDKMNICPKLRVLSVASLIGQAIKRIHRGDSVSSLFV